MKPIVSAMDCGSCKKPGARFACGDCKKAPVLVGDAPIVHYCDAACQKANWKAHKKNTCDRLQDRTTLYRVADTAQKLFYIAQELTWGQLDIKKVTKQGNVLILHGNFLESLTWPKDYKVFPAHLLPMKQDQEAALSFLGCIMAAVWMLEFVKGILFDIVSETTYIKCKTKNERRETRRYPITDDLIIWTSSLPPTRHEILKLTLRSGEIFAVDLSGAQYGYHEPVMRWEEYEQTRIREIEASHLPPRPIGILEVEDYSIQQMCVLYQRVFMTKKTTSPRFPVRVGALEDILELMGLWMVKWQFEGKSGLKNLWKFPEEKFLRKQKNLVDFVDWKLHDTTKPYFTVNGRRLEGIMKGSYDWIYVRE